MTNPYRGRPERSFWRSAVTERHVADFTGMWDPMPLTRADKVATAGSCFAQHIGRNLERRGAAYMDCEPAPPVFASESEARRFGYGVFSCRYGNVYTARQLLQLAQEAFGERRPAEVVWQKNDRFFDALRPGIDPVGQASAEDVRIERLRHLDAVRTMFETLDVFVFTLGLTEGWESLEDGTMFPTAPGTIAGSFDPERYAFRNLRYGEVMADMRAFWAFLKLANPGARMLLTVSPVPLVATATGQHVLPATTYSKSVLRAVAGDLAADEDDIHYFPSYEVIIGHPSRGMFFQPDLREVNEFGVNLVMSQFFSGPLAQEFGQHDAPPEDEEEFDVICDEGRITEDL
ncbi:GSCFA domain-containing protein [Novosphingobium sp.]|uniref:GSCFA domain-containing protein n=1 Tax=Novosphingobium sp. TaxID=1874826 RepID=UPI0038B8DF75